MPDLHHPLSTLALIGCLTAALTGCAASIDRSPTRTAIENLAGAARCEIDGQCRVLPLGARPCGGADGFLAWSVLETDGAQLQALGERYEQEREAAHERTGRASTCEPRVAPAVRCVRPNRAQAGRCTLQPQARGSDAAV